MDTDNSQNILQFLKEHGPSSTAQVAAHLGITTQGAHKRLKKFIESKQVEQTGIHPNIVYRLAQAPTPDAAVGASGQAPLAGETPAPPETAPAPQKPPEGGSTASGQSSLPVRQAGGTVGARHDTTPDTNQELQTLRQKITQLENQNKQIQNRLDQTNEQLKSVLARSEATKQSNEKEMASQKALAMTQKDQIEHLTQENRRLNDRYENEEGINQDLENKLKAVMAEKGQVSTEKDFSIQFDENGDMIK